ncbi:hypothetical protein [Faucicola atlantae]|uniref:Uncharacterized protein n=1 Tax=Faucicola atlantae TaxID=34059 RepID=A0A1B8QF43_9GAMM|nr:hypothetical protein [Moraxella atlantae]OBX80515.1 hypothetical protein A9306_07395 [Moraxella atlantae]
MTQPTLSPNIIQALVTDGHILPIHDPQPVITQEQTSLNRLRHRTTRNLAEQYLNGYDRLFRHISLLLLAHSYELTACQLHQTLRKICQQWQANNVVTAMIQQRHTLKKSVSPSADVDLQALNTLQTLLGLFDSTDAAAFRLADENR